MLRIQSWLALVLVCSCTLAPLALAAPAAGNVPTASASTTGHAASDSWVGALSGIACGLSIKVTILTGGTVVATIAAAVSTCALMILDGLVDPH